MKQEYRKASAEALGIKKRHPRNIGGYKEFKSFPKDYFHEGHRWHPDQKADQMLMVWEWMNKKGFKLNIEYDEESNQWMATGDVHWGIFDKSIFNATMKAFMEYIKTK